MGDAGSSQGSLIKQIFHTMEYGDDLENTAGATEWLKTRENRIFAYIDKKDESPNGEILSIKSAYNEENVCDIHVPEAATIEAILKKVGDSKNEWIEISPTKRAEIIYKLGTEVQKKQDLFVQLEIAVRGILSKDTKNKALPLLTDCLQYYSSFCVKYHTENPSWKPEGLAVSILPDTNFLAALGYILGPSLAAGYQVILQTGPKISLVVSLLIELAIQVGVPEGTIRLIPGNVDSNIFFTHPKVSIISIFDDLYKKEYLFANHFNKKLLHYYSSGIPMVVFDNCDLDSACHSVVDAVWGYNGMLPWSVKNIFVQESVYKNFVDKLKQKISQVKVGESNKKNVDISYPDDQTLNKLTHIVERAKSAGRNVYQPNTNVIPSILLGGIIFPQNVIQGYLMNIPLVTVIPFRTINEAVALSNNTIQGLGVSIWTESTSTVNEIIEKLKVGNIWVNSHGSFAADISVSPYKTSGNAYFGGSAGFYEYVQVKPLKNEQIISEIQNGEAMEKAIAEAKKAHDGWFKLSYFDRMKKLQVIAQNIQTKNSTWGLPEKWVEQWLTLIHECVLNNSVQNFHKDASFNVVTTREPLGVIAVETGEDKEFHNKRTIIAALHEGNSVIILNDSKETNDFYSVIGNLLPKGVLTVVTDTLAVTRVAALHRELNSYIGEKNNKIFCSLELKRSHQFKMANLGTWEEVRNKVGLNKNVWLNKGQSFI